jgi:hypothetical protein
VFDVPTAIFPSRNEIAPPVILDETETKFAGRVGRPVREPRVGVTTRRLMSSFRGSGPRAVAASLP